MKPFAKTVAVAFALWLVTTTGAFAQEEDEMAPLDGVIADMQVAGGRLGKMLTDKATQQKEKEAIDKLAALIKLLEERRGQNGGQSSANPDKPAEDSVIKAGPGGSGPLHDANRKGRGWGQLPAHKRQQILQSMTEGFPPHYQQLLERYYRRLAEEKPSGEPADEPAAPATKPSAAAMKKGPAVAMEKPSAGGAGQKPPAEAATP
jgi:hypothetical protein